MNFKWQRRQYSYKSDFHKYLKKFKMYTAYQRKRDYNYEIKKKKI